MGSFRCTTKSVQNVEAEYRFGWKDGEFRREAEFLRRDCGDWLRVVVAAAGRREDGAGVWGGI